MRNARSVREEIERRRGDGMDQGKERGWNGPREGEGMEWTKGRRGDGMDQGKERGWNGPREGEGMEWTKGRRGDGMDQGKERGMECKKKRVTVQEH